MKVYAWVVAVALPAFAAAYALAFFGWVAAGWYRHRARSVGRFTWGARPADAFTMARLPDGGVQGRLVDERGMVIAWIDWDRADVRATRDALSQVLRAM